MRNLFDYYCSQNNGKTFTLAAVNLTVEEVEKIKRLVRERESPGVVRKFVPVTVTDNHKIYMHKRAEIVR